MTALRALIANHRRLAALLVALALCMKALIPAGTMIAATPKVLTVAICTDAGGPAMTRDVVVPMRPDAGAADGQAKQGAGAPCGWSVLGLGGLAATDPVVLAAALAFIALAGFRPAPAPPATAPARLRPPLRAPPAFA